MQRFICCLVGGLLIALTASADVYTYVDAQGNRVFTDQPHSGAHRVDIPPSNTMTGTLSPRKDAKTRPATAKPRPLFHYQLVRILVPEPDATVRNMAGELIVSVNNDPDLQPGHLYRLLLDGKPIAEAGRSPVFPLTNIDRGTHLLAVEILDETGRMLERTPSQEFHMLRITLAQKRQAQPCTNEDYGVRPECPLADKPPEKSSFLPFL
ncbi:DUF4124 domain-containing protein [Pseudomonas sp. 10B1]|uniref:DUF4124 domain-containing protein n=1 Tax=unclassified Pseudomonas TaxID=196821 RepID=UPI002AB346D2|nr:MULTISPECIES: DUF4124 domain-containing protein [unclassified Pseudomonas]MDY7562367.1 DUF4124 domain-containing protein [Pseudomonas sp. AB6]MEA9976402.1 DUF4124 domain-containing protein [Pseudomonas sp. RTS4]MEA9994709.1 DUF4124 domain-containing protein [Pseudomonas sp. AA4]MEB0086372.1 DUF4124 domain-containing protein [Pseudomonas sp. RTI1]MEB0126429.1 DUF4124 domain-containing protein [Pseudomonas sp. CCC1.2]